MEHRKVFINLPSCYYSRMMETIMFKVPEGTKAKLRGVRR